MDPSVRIIKQCRACNSKELVDVLSLGNLSLSDFKKNITKKPKRYPLFLVLCKRCTLLQLKHTVSPNDLYTERYGYRSGINQTMKDELKEIVYKSLQKIDKKTKDLVVVDIGANDGTLLSNYSQDILKVAIEPIKKFAQEAKAKADIVINDFFNIKSYQQKLNNTKANIITAISCFYDIDSPNQFLSDIKKILHKDGIFVIQQNYLVGMIEKNAFDNIVHEHLEYYSLLSLENLLKKHDLEVFDIELSDINGGSFRTFICHKGTKKTKQSVQRIRGSEEKLKLNDVEKYKKFAINVKENKKKVLNYIKNLVKKNKKVYLYGASTRGNTLLQYYNLDTKLIKKAVERNKEKWGKKILSVRIPIISEEQARKDKPDYMLVLPWFFKEEFLRREKNYLKSGGHFIFPLPSLDVV